MTFCLHYGSRSFETSGLYVYLTIDFLIDVTKNQAISRYEGLFSFPFRFFKMFISIHLSAHTYLPTNTHLMVSNSVIELKHVSYIA